ncbi:MAG: polysaccharide biosynthesis/export family protein [Bryobacteraceae bacterium]|nr:polysaccharide biosynthesis/export family protein [Bryobacteraceae bacterium]
MSRFLLLLLCGLLAHAQQSAAPALAGANLPAQRIGPNDLVAVSVYDAPEFTRTIRVGDDGMIRLPMVQRRISAKGLLPSELEDSIGGALEDEQILVSPVVTVTIVEYHSRPISVAGAVYRPTTFQADTAVSLLDALTRADGLRPEAGPEILISRSQPGPNGDPMTLIQRVPAKELLSGADPEWNVMLQGGEEVRVPEAGKVFVVGNVKKPGAFRVDDTAGTSVLKMLALSEGLMPFASKLAYVYRKEAGSGSKNEIEIPLRDIMERKAADVTLQENDILYVPDNRSKRAKITALEKIIGFGSATASGVLIWGVAR